MSLHRTGVGARAVLLAALVALPSCGGRSSLGFGTDGSTRRDGRRPPADGHLLVDGYLLADSQMPVDQHRWIDSCLPVPAGQIQGDYRGTWQGTWTCPGPGAGASPIHGDLVLSLSPEVSPSAFAVKGYMQGSVSSGLPFAGAVTGSMSCISLSGTMPSIVVGGGVSELAGSLSGTLQGTGGTLGFSGSWSVKEKKGGCGASGSWSARR